MSTSVTYRSLLQWFPVDKVEYESRNDNCPICFDPLNGEKIVITHGRIGHFFCKQCIRELNKSKHSSFNKCPTCRVTVDPLQFDHIDYFKEKYQSMVELPSRLSLIFKENCDNLEYKARWLTYGLIGLGCIAIIASMYMEEHNNIYLRTSHSLISIAGVSYATSDFFSKRGFGPENLCVMRTHLIGAALITTAGWSLFFRSMPSITVAGAFGLTGLITFVSDSVFGAIKKLNNAN